jgi:hypothetical protein
MANIKLASPVGSTTGLTRRQDVLQSSPKEPKKMETRGKGRQAQAALKIDLPPDIGQTGQRRGVMKDQNLVAQTVTAISPI